MANNNQSFFKRTYVRIGAVALVLILLAFFFIGGNEASEVVAENTTSPRTVSLHTISADNGTAVRTADGSAFIVRAQSGGRVDRVAKVGDTVTAGATVAQLENSAQRAAYIQAEGAYDAAVAAAGGNTTAQSTARQDAVRTWNTETVSTAQIIHTSIDTYFTFSRSLSSITGFRGLSAFGDAGIFNSRRADIEEILKAWERNAAIVTETNATEMLTSLSNELSVIGAFVDDLAALVPQQRINDSYTDEQRSNDITRLATARANITESQRRVDSTRTAIINSSGSNAAASNAQIKQAFGALESARAALGKTVIKTPVAGTVTAVSISVGDIINVGNDVVFVAGDTAVKTESIITVPLTAVKFTPTKAFIFTVDEEVLVAHEVETGLVSSNSITISGAEGITDIVIDVRGLKEGDTVVTQ
jgi:multidrug efflux pump subunit AcrA (membrane-fusion protein)